MAPRYERVNDHDADNDDNEHTLLPSPTDPAPTSTYPSRSQPIPDSPPPSFHSRASSPTATSRHHRMSSALVDAFESDDDASDNDDDDDVRQRLVRRSTAESLDAHTQQGSSSGAAVASRVVQVTSASAAAGNSNAQGASASTPTTRGTPLRVFGSGMQSDGVFSNLSARPEVGDNAEKEELPPTYEQAAADQAPPYWETTILAPGLGGPDEVYLDGMPIGSLFSFLWNAMISMSFQLVGFLLTYLLHSTHAAKNGSRAGLGVTLIQYGFYLRGSPTDGPSTGTDNNGYSAPSDPNSHDFDPNNVGTDGGNAFAAITASEWMAYVMMVVGWFVLIRAVSDYLRARRHEMLVLGGPENRFGVVGVFAEGETPDRVV